MSNRNLILEPFCCILRIILLEYKPDGTKISIQNNSILYNDPSIYQGVMRTIYGDNREDIHNLYAPILKGFEWFSITDSKINRFFFERLISGLEKLNKAYNENTIIHHSISHYITMVRDLIDINDLSKYKNNDKKESPLIEELKNIWDNDELYIIYKNLYFINNSEDDELTKTYIKSIEDILSYKEKQVEKYINNSSTTY